jgi:HEAT repeat protein
MRPISPHTRALIERLNQSDSLWETLRGSRDGAALLSKIGNSNEPAAIIDILPFVLSKKSDVAIAAAVAVHKLVLGTTTKELIWLDCAIRQRSPYSGNSFYEWHKMSPGQLDLLERFGDPSVSLLGMASFHQNGYVRQAAIDRLDLIASGAELPFLILRLNDWVPEVRGAAYEAIRSRLRPEYGRSFVINLALVSRLEEAGRTDHKAVLQAINDLLQTDECRTVLLDSLKSADRFIRRASFRLAMNSAGADLREVFKQALDDDDTVVRLWAAQKVSSAFAGAMLDDFLEVMRRDRFMPVRREALRLFVKRREDRAPEELRSALLDRHASMREEARYHLRTIAPIDVAAFYRQALLVGESTNLYPTICGLGETGSAADDRLILSYTLHRLGKVRGAAFRALAGLNGTAHVDLFCNALKDKVPQVSRQALRALADKTSYISGEKVWEIFDSSSHGHVKRNALSLLERLPKWDSIYYLVKAIGDPDEAVVDMSRFGIKRWLAGFNRTFTLPSGGQVARLNTALEDCDDLLDEETKKQIRFSM